MSVGDPSGNAKRVVDVLASIQYPRKVSASKLRDGDPSVLLPILHYVLLDYSPHASSFVRSVSGASLHDRDDASFTDAVFRLAIMHLRLHPGLNARQFLSPGFVERKLLLVVDVVKAVQALHEDAERASIMKRNVLPYTSHHTLEDGHGTSRNLGFESRREPAPTPNTILPPRAQALPASSAMPPRVYSGTIYSAGMSAGPSPSAVYRFLSDAVALGEGAHASIAARRKQVLGEAAAAGTASLSAALNPGHLTSAGWRERVAQEAAAIRQRQAQAPHPPAPGGSGGGSSPSRLPIHKSRLPGGMHAQSQSLDRSPPRPVLTVDTLSMTGGSTSTGLPVQPKWPGYGAPVAPPAAPLPSAHTQSLAHSTASPPQDELPPVLAPAAVQAAAQFTADLERSSTTIASNLAALESRLAMLESTERALRAAAPVAHGQGQADYYAHVHVPAAPRPSTAPHAPREMYSYLPPGLASSLLGEGMGGEVVGDGDSDPRFLEARASLQERRRRAAGRGGNPVHTPSVGTTAGSASMEAFLARMSAGVAATDAAMARARPMLDHAASLSG